ncbi:hypothetical protein COV19_02380 [Candidatus Woesearchaeota archaeon CG10_big_fil_rev_8_21_14_0_10_44_13]|nr:MAG: hypothetical protein COV19_02380 [Candidatus Woesearchaeota archaeon CG10_big_fil_rev_8_21_14_0_10_44_13]
MITPEKAADLLEDVKENSHFKLHMGTNIASLKQLAEALDIMAEAAFNHHVNANKNDFAAWIRHSIGDAELADTINKMRDRKRISAAVRKRVDFLETKSRENKLSGKDFLTCGVTDFILGAVIGFVIGMIFAVII